MGSNAAAPGANLAQILGNSPRPARFVGVAGTTRARGGDASGSIALCPTKTVALAPRRRRRESRDTALLRRHRREEARSGVNIYTHLLLYGRNLPARSQGTAATKSVAASP